MQFEIGFEVGFNIVFKNVVIPTSGTQEQQVAEIVQMTAQHFEDGIKGTIEVGKLADLVVLSEDPLSMPADELLKLKVMATYSHGKEIFKNGK